MSLVCNVVETTARERKEIERTSERGWKNWELDLSRVMMSTSGIYYVAVIIAWLERTRLRGRAYRRKKNPKRVFVWVCVCVHVYVCVERRLPALDASGHQSLYAISPAPTCAYVCSRRVIIMVNVWLWPYRSALTVSYLRCARRWYADDVLNEIIKNGKYTRRNVL